MSKFRLLKCVLSVISAGIVAVILAETGTEISAENDTVNFMSLVINSSEISLKASLIAILTNIRKYKLTMTYH
jgi:hypothetical protein